jgi:hypothetical protein
MKSTRNSAHTKWDRNIEGLGSDRQERGFFRRDLVQFFPQMKLSEPQLGHKPGETNYPRAGML